MESPAHTGPPLPVFDVVLNVPRVPVPECLQETRKARRPREPLDSDTAQSYHRAQNRGSQAEISAIQNNWLKYQRCLDILEKERLCKD